MCHGQSVVLFVLIAMVVLYGVEHRWPPAPLKFSADSNIFGGSEFAIGLRPWERPSRDLFCWYHIDST
jgi:hypothetical protein